MAQTSETTPVAALPAVGLAGPLIGGAPADGTRPSLPRRERAAEGFWAGSMRRLWHNRVAIAALIGLLVLALASFAAPLIARLLGQNRDAIDLLNNYKAPSPAHWFGTDEYGRDYFVRVLYGGQISILMGLGVAAIILSVAIPVGLAAGYYGHLVDDVFLWVSQVHASVPLLFVLILVATWIPPTPISIAIIIGLNGWFGNARQARGLTFTLKRGDYVLAARTLGASNTRIMYRHIMPNIVSLMIVLAGFDVIAGILAEVGLSYLGLGIRPPLPSWGNMLTNSLSYIFRAPHLVVFPGLAVGLLVLCVYMLADGLRDAFDPRLKE